MRSVNFRHGPERIDVSCKGGRLTKLVFAALTAGGSLYHDYQNERL